LSAPGVAKKKFLNGDVLFVVVDGDRDACVEVVSSIPSIGMDAP